MISSSIWQQIFSRHNGYTCSHCGKIIEDNEEYKKLGKEVFHAECFENVFGEALV